MIPAMQPILVTGAAGFIGVSLARALRGSGRLVRCLDLHASAASERDDVRDAAAMRQAVAECSGVIHLAAVSRVAWAERDPENCWQTNVHGTRNVLAAAQLAASTPWVVVASSREVYGRPARLPVNEDAPLQPINVYGRSKAATEGLVREAASGGLRAAIARFANVYGRVEDHPDRVVPAFARAAAEGAPMRVCGCGHTFDFTHIDDVVNGIVRLVHALEDGLTAPPPVHFVTGQGTTLGELAALANALGCERSSLVEDAARDYDVTHFVGDPGRAQKLLSWRAEVDLKQGVQRLIRAFADGRAAVLDRERQGIDAAFGRDALSG